MYTFMFSLIGDYLQAFFTLGDLTRKTSRDCTERTDAVMLHFVEIRRALTYIIIIARSPQYFWQPKTIAK